MRRFLNSLGIFIVATLFVLQGAKLRAEDDTLRIGQWNADLSRDGPGMLIKDILDSNEELDAMSQTIQKLQLDMLVLTDVDQDDEAWAAALLGQKFGFNYAHLGPNNTGLWLQSDVNNDGRRDGNDKQSYAKFRGQGSMLILSNMRANAAYSFNTLPLHAFSEMPKRDGANYYSDQTWQELRLASSAFLDIDFGAFHILSAHATAPAFEGRELRNTLRNAAEIHWWKRYISGESFPSDQGQDIKLDAAFILIGTLNVDPEKGNGDRAALRALLSDPRLRPVRFARRETVDWTKIDLGEMQVDYILPSCEWQTLRSGQAEMGTSHRLLWADLKQHPNCNF